MQLRERLMNFIKIKKMKHLDVSALNVQEMNLIEMEMTVGGTWIDFLDSMVHVSHKLKEILLDLKEFAKVGYEIYKFIKG